MSTPPFSLYRDAYGRLVFKAENGAPTDHPPGTANASLHVGVTPVRAFPIADPDAGLALISAEGHELAWVEHLDHLPGPMRALIEEELASREFIPEIQRIESVSGFACPSTWQLLTDRGPASLTLKGEEDIRRLSQDRLLIADAHGIEFLIRELGALDRHSRKLLDRFL